MEIIPAIIGKNIREIRDKVEKVQDFVRWIQIDIMDGIFVPTKSWPYTDGEFSDLMDIDYIRTDTLRLEFHLMVQNPEDIIEKLVESGADRIIFHYESTERAQEIIRFLEEEEVECGISFKFETDISVVDKYLPDIDLVQFMSISEIGSYGQEFQEGVIEKIKNLKERHPGLVISVDGGVNIENIKNLKDAGAENFVVGSGIFGEGKIPSEEIERLKKVI